MDAEEIARIVAEYLNDRDDIASATAIEDLNQVHVKTQGGSDYGITVERI